MKPLLLHGHERSITMIKYNRQGDLLFSAAKDSKPTVWYSLNGERLGTFNGHGGVTWCLDVSWDTRQLMTGSGDNSLRIWDVETGQQVSLYETQSGIRTCGYSYGSKQIMFTTDQSMGKECEILFYDVRENPATSHPYLALPVPQSKVTAAVWGPCDEYIITGHENGVIQKWDAQTGQVLDQIKEHSKSVNSIQKSHDDSMFISGSKDTTAKLFDMESLMHIKTYKTERPINSAAISPLRDHVILGGGQEAMEVTTTSTKIGKFDARFFHLVFEEEIGRVKGHFGPIQSLAIHPDGRSYSSGAEDGYVRVHQFDPSYFDFEFEY